MSIPDRPVDGAEIATEWGQEIHDRVFAPRGCLVHGSSGVSCPNTGALVTVPVTTADDDPGGWLDAAHDRIEAPVGGEGLYTYSARWTTDNLNEADEIRVYLQVNGSSVDRATESGEGSTGIDLSVAGVVVLAAGDQISAKAKKIGSAGAAVTLTLARLTVVRLGAEYGA